MDTYEKDTLAELILECNETLEALALSTDMLRVLELRSDDNPTEGQCRRIELTDLVDEHRKSFVDSLDKLHQHLCDIGCNEFSQLLETALLSDDELRASCAEVKS